MTRRDRVAGYAAVLFIVLLAFVCALRGERFTHEVQDWYHNWQASDGEEE